jgi:FO synthase
MNAIDNDLRRLPTDVDGANSASAWRRLSRTTSTLELAAMAAAIRDRCFGNRLTYSRKVFIPLTQLCRDVCHYCTFAKAPRTLTSPYMGRDEVVAVARLGKEAGCKEALFTLGERPESRYRVAADWLSKNGYGSTIEYVAEMCRTVLEETGLLPHVNAGTMTDAEIELLRPVSASMGLMLETSAERLCERGMPHHGSPDKVPAVRLETLDRLGAHRVPTTSGILIGIGETEEERIDALLALKRLHDRHGHIQEIIVQNFKAKPDTRMASHPEPSHGELIRTIAFARLIFGDTASIQVPPNLSPDGLADLVDAGIDDLGGISPVTIDHVNPEAPWPHLDRMSAGLGQIGRTLTERLTVYPRHQAEPGRWLDRGVLTPVLRLGDAEGLGREDGWRAGESPTPPQAVLALISAPVSPSVTPSIGRIIDKAAGGLRLAVSEIEALFRVRGADMAFVCGAADRLRLEAVGDVVSYVVTRNINYTNVCTYGCRFCAFSKGKTNAGMRGTPYNISLDEVARRTREAWARGASEVCMQGGINPDYTGETYLSICRAVKADCPEMHIHAFSPLEVSQGARTLGIPVSEFLRMLKTEGLGSLPGTAAEILDDEVRAMLCPDKLSTDEWLAVIEAAHEAGLRTTATIMFGHVDRPIHWARHLAHIRALQDRTGGFTEFVPLPFVASEAPMFLKGQARPGPTFREAVLMHAVARIAFHTAIPNIQASWVKLGPEGTKVCLNAGVNDLGGTLMNESITRSAGAIHGEEISPRDLEALIVATGRVPRQRTTLYDTAAAERRLTSWEAADLTPVQNARFERSAPR